MTKWNRYDDISSSEQLADGDTFLVRNLSDTTQSAFGSVNEVTFALLKANVVHSVKSYGAVGDGVTDDTTAIQSAIDALADTGGEVILHPGNYVITDTLTIENPGICIRGIGGIGNSHAANTETNRGATIVNKSGDSDAIKIGKNETYLSDIVLRDFAIDGDSGTASAGHGIVLDSFGYDPSGVSSVKLYNVSIHHVKNYGLYLHGNIFEVALFGVEFRFNNYAVYAETNGGGQVSQISFHGCGLWKSTEAGFYKGTGVSDITFYGSRFGYNDVGALSALATSFHGCTFESNTTAGIQFGSYNTKVFGGTFASNGTAIDGVDSGGGYGMILGAYFTGNTVDIDIPNGCRRTIIGGVYGASDTLVISNADRTTKFLDNNFHSMTEAGAARTYGITEFNSTGGAFAVTLADGTAIGQIKIFKFDTDGGNVTLTVAHHETSDPEVFTFDDIGDFLELRWTGSTWCTIKNVGVGT